MSSVVTAGLSVRELTKSYGAVRALDDVSFQANPGEVFGLLGPNGAGKTTALECLLGLREPDKGSIRIGELDARRNPNQAKTWMGAQLQSAALQDRLTPRQAIRLFGSFYRNAVPAPELLSRFGLSRHADSPFETLSGGYRQRLFLALAFVNRPKVLVLDEPTVGLDPTARGELHALINSLKETGAAVILSTHYLEEAEALCDRIGILDRGRMIALGSSDELIAQSRALPRVIFRCSRTLEEQDVRSLAGVVQAIARGAHWELQTRDTHATIVALTQQLRGATLLDLQVHPATLENVYFELTGRTFTSELKGEAR